MVMLLQPKTKYCDVMPFRESQQRWRRGQQRRERERVCSDRPPPQLSVLRGDDSADGIDGEENHQQQGSADGIDKEPAAAVGVGVVSSGATASRRSTLYSQAVTRVDIA